MRCLTLAALAACALTVGLVTTAAGGLVDIGVGVYGGAYSCVQTEDRVGDDAQTNGTVLGVKLRVLPPVPMVGADIYYKRVLNEDPEDVWNDGDLSVDFDGGGFDVFGVDVLIGGVKGAPGLKWYGVAGINFVEFLGDDLSERRVGWDAGLGVEFVLPVVGLSAEVCGVVTVFDAGEQSGTKMASATLGLNYYF